MINFPIFIYFKLMVKRKYSLSSKRWLDNHFNDQYVRKVKSMQVRSRAWFKIDQIHSVDCLFYPGMTVVDLGSTPGSWSQYARKKIGQCGRVISCDILPMNKIAGVDFLRGDFCDQSILYELIAQTKKKKADIVLSDMCPNISGKANIDIPKFMYLVEMALDFCEYVLISGGSFLVKVFQGEGFDEYFNNIRFLFNSVKIRKPFASCIRSREVYIVAKGYKI